MYINLSVRHCEERETTEEAISIQTMKKYNLILIIVLNMIWQLPAQTVFNEVYNDYEYYFTRQADSFSFYNSEGFYALRNTYDGNYLLAGAGANQSFLGDTSTYVYIYI